MSALFITYVASCLFAGRRYAGWFWAKELRLRAQAEERLYNTRTDEGPGFPLFMGLIGGALWPLVETVKAAFWVHDKFPGLYQRIFLPMPKETKREQIQAKIDKLEKELDLA